MAEEMVKSAWKEMEEKGVVEVRSMLQEGSLLNILESVFGSNDKSEELGDMVKEGYELIAKFNLEDYFPLKFLDFHGVKRRCHKLAAKVGSVVGQIVEERKRDGSFVGKNDFLSTLLSLPKEERLDDSDMVAILWVSTLPIFLLPNPTLSGPPSMEDNNNINKVKPYKSMHPFPHAT